MGHSDYDHFKRKADDLDREVSRLEQECSTEAVGRRFNMLMIIGGLIPVVVWLLCRYVLTKYFLLDDKTKEADTGKIFIYTLVISVASWIGLYFYSKMKCKKTENSVNMMMV
jgi:hypothetical protein